MVSLTEPHTDFDQSGGGKGKQAGTATHSQRSASDLQHSQVTGDGHSAEASSTAGNAVRSSKKDVHQVIGKTLTQIQKCSHL